MAQKTGPYSYAIEKYLKSNYWWYNNLLLNYYCLCTHLVMLFYNSYDLDYNVNYESPSLCLRGAGFLCPTMYIQREGISVYLTLNHVIIKYYETVNHEGKWYHLSRHSYVGTLIRALIFDTASWSQCQSRFSRC